MKKASETERQKTNPLKEKIIRLKNGHLTCPFCREEFKGLKELLSHIKGHCR